MPVGDRHFSLVNGFVASIDLLALSNELGTRLHCPDAALIQQQHALYTTQRWATPLPFDRSMEKPEEADVIMSSPVGGCPGTHS